MYVWGVSVGIKYEREQERRREGEVLHQHL